jgi:hypothetical protein
VIVLVTRNHVEEHAAKLPLHGAHRELEPCYSERLLAVMDDLCRQMAIIRRIGRDIGQVPIRPAQKDPPLSGKNKQLRAQLQAGSLADLDADQVRATSEDLVLML